VIEELATSTANQALITLVVEEFQKVNQNYLGRTAIQKICYFAQSLGVPLSCRYQILHYGPYSEELASEIDMLLAVEALKDISPQRSKYSNFQLGPNAYALINGHKAMVERFRPLVAPVASAFGKLDPQTLELLSTLHFIDRKFKASGMPHPGKEQVIRRFEEVKKERFARSIVESAYDSLMQAKLIG